jgi:hypothetical protein
LFAAATIVADLHLGNTVAVVFTAEDEDPAPGTMPCAPNSSASKPARTGPASAHAPDWIQQLVLAADQFIVSRDIAGQPGKSILAIIPGSAIGGATR